MSRIGKLPVDIVSGVTISVVDNIVSVKGPKGDLSFDLPAGISASIDGEKVVIVRSDDEKQSKALHGLSRAMIANMVEGVTNGFEKRLEIIGVGYRASTSGQKIDLTLGFSHPVSLVAPEGVTVKMSEDKKDKNVIIVSGCDKQAVGEFAANIRKLRKPEPYKGKGIRYQGEYVRRKAGKSASS